MSFARPLYREDIQVDGRAVVARHGTGKQAVQVGRGCRTTTSFTRGETAWAAGLTGATRKRACFEGGRANTAAHRSCALAQSAPSDVQ